MLERDAVRGESKDLAKQVQTLLKTRLETPSSTPLLPPSSASLDDTSVFTNVDELQSCNQSLVSEVNNLKATVSHLRKTDDKASLNARLNDAVEELKSLKEERSKQELMVEAIVEQRDMYRKLLAQSDARYDDEKGGADESQGAKGGHLEASR